MIVRSPRPADGFTVLGNNVLQDQSLSYRARGLLASILSRPDNWRTDAAQLAREGREGREAVLSTLRELTEAGYIVRTKRQITRAEAAADDSLKAGQWVSSTTVYDTPQPVNPEPENPASGQRESANPVTGNPASAELSAGPPDAIQRTETKDCSSWSPPRLESPARTREKTDGRTPKVRDGHPEHEHHANATAWCIRVQRELRLPIEAPELLAWCYRLGDGDPWAGHRLAARQLDGLDTANNPTRALRARLRDAQPRRRDEAPDYLELAR